MATTDIIAEEVISKRELIFESSCGAFLSSGLAGEAAGVAPGRVGLQGFGFQRNIDSFAEELGAGVFVGTCSPESFTCLG